MSGVQPHAHQAQHGLSTGSQPFFQQQRDGAGIHGGSGHMMDASQFAEFSFPFSGLPDQVRSHMMPMADVSHVGYEGPAAAQFSQHRTMAATLPPEPHPMAPMVAMPTSSLAMDSDNHRSSPVESDDDGGVDRNSPTANTFEDPVADEFGLHGLSRGDGSDLGGRKDGKSDAPPAWSELKTKAGKDRKRLPLACIACKKELHSSPVPSLSQRSRALSHRASRFLRSEAPTRHSAQIWRLGRRLPPNQNLLKSGTNSRLPRHKKKRKTSCLAKASTPCRQRKSRSI